MLQILSFFLVLLPINLYAQKGKDSYSSSSVLSSGKWFRIAVTEDGIYRIDFAKLKQLGLMNPSEPRIFCNNFGQLSYYNDAPRPDDLKELSVFFFKGPPTEYLMKVIISCFLEKVPAGGIIMKPIKNLTSSGIIIPIQHFISLLREQLREKV